MFVKIFQVLVDDQWVKKMNLSSLQLKNFFKFVLAWLAREEQNTVDSW